MSEIKNYDVCLTYSPVAPTYRFQRTVAAASEEEALRAARLSFEQGHPGATVTMTEVARPRRRYLAQVDFLDKPPKLTRIETTDAVSTEAAADQIRAEFLRKNPDATIVAITVTQPGIRD